jgi:hypothetical protein
VVSDIQAGPPSIQITMLVNVPIVSDLVCVVCVGFRLVFVGFRLLRTLSEFVVSDSFSLVSDSFSLVSEC